MKIETKEKVIIEGLTVESDCLDLNIGKPNLTKILYDNTNTTLSFTVQTKDFGEVNLEFQPFTENQVNNITSVHNDLCKLFWSESQ